MPTCFNCNRESDSAHYDRVVHNRTELHGPWAGWRMAGRELVSPEGQRFTTERLRGLAFRLEAEQRLERARLRNASRKARQQVVKVVVVDLRDWRERHFGRSA
ncbi:DUF3653 domain-containing protein [Luteimonas sp. TWI1437]|uniref:DUF3653 domain-containing protein n=1 Tax=unclassified Luteimonas TaxID=2629088 RepID=UPI003208E403